jgi:hypothetical protein
MIACPDLHEREDNRCTGKLSRTFFLTNFVTLLYLKQFTCQKGEWFKMTRDELLREIAKATPPDLEQLLRQIEAEQVAAKRPIAA